VHCSTYTYNELDEEKYESSVIENPKEIEITSNESCEQSCGVEFTIPKDYLTDNFKIILSKAELVIHLGVNDAPLLINIGGKNLEFSDKQNSKTKSLDITHLFASLEQEIIIVMISANGTGTAIINDLYIRLTIES
jgi:hypothetical protein